MSESAKVGKWGAKSTGEIKPALLAELFSHFGAANDGPLSELRGAAGERALGCLPKGVPFVDVLGLMPTRMGQSSADKNHGSSNKNSETHDERVGCVEQAEYEMEMMLNDCGSSCANESV
jgi:hypothetical protein